MFTIIAKTLNYISAYLIVYPLLMFRVIFPNLANGSSGYHAIKSNSSFLFILSALFVLSIIWLVGLLHWKNNMLIKGEVKKNKTMEMVSFLVTYGVLFMPIDINLVSIVIGGVLFIFVGIAFTASDEHFLNPTFLLFGYKLYKLDDKCILYKGSSDALKIELKENPDGISARELVQNTYIVLSK